MPKKKSKTSGITGVTFIIAIIALGLSGYSFLFPQILSTPKVSVYLGDSYNAPVGIYTKVNFDEVTYDDSNVLYV